MGLCSSGDAHAKALAKSDPESYEVSKTLERRLLLEKEAKKPNLKILLLGAGESGKSTIFKQMRVIYGQGFSEENRKQFRPVIHTHIIKSLQNLIDVSEILAKKGISGCTPVQGPGATIIRELKEDAWIDSELALVISNVWTSEAIQKVWENRQLYQYSDSAEYFLSKVVEVGRESYIPTISDVFRVRVRTRGIVEDEFTIDDRSVSVYDAGGQRSERKKWTQAFANVTAVLFVAALSEYDMVLDESPDTNRLDEALYLFENICNSRWFVNTHMILFLNKTDLFKAKLSKSPMKDYLPEFKGPNEYEPGCAFIQELFEKKNENPLKKIYVHFTCATDTDHCRLVFDSIKHIILTDSLRCAGLLE